MEYLYVANSMIEGPIPSSFGLMKNFIKLDLSHNKFSGTMPHFLSKLEKTIFLSLTINELVRMIPQRYVLIIILFFLNFIHSSID